MTEDRIDPADLVTHRRLVEMTRDVSTRHAFWSEHLSQKYGLTDADRIDADGQIVRKPETTDG